MVNKLKKYQGKYYFWNYKCQNRWNYILNEFVNELTIEESTSCNKTININIRQQYVIKFKMIFLKGT